VARRPAVADGNGAVGSSAQDVYAAFGD